MLIFEHYADRDKEFSAVYLKTQFQNDISILTWMTDYMEHKESVWSQSDQRKQVLTVKLDQERDICYKFPKAYTSSLMETDFRLASQSNYIFFIIHHLFMFKLLDELWVINFKVGWNNFWVILLLPFSTPKFKIHSFQY